jgi:metal-responsive CopG/Arc/MetJ family transcriptional regulator
MSKTINIRLPDELLEEYEKHILPQTIRETGLCNLSRNDVIVKALDEFARSYKAKRQQEKKG